MAAPTAVAVDADGNLYVTESSRDRVLMFDRFGGFAGELKGFKRPVGIAVDRDGKVYVGSAGRGNVAVFDGALHFLRKLGSGDGEFRLPIGIAVAATGTVYVADAGRDEVRVYAPDGSFAFAFGAHGDGDGAFHFPTGLAVDDAAGEVVVPDLQVTALGNRGARIQAFGLDGTFRRRFGSFGMGEGLLVKPTGVAVDDAGRIYVADAYQNVVQVFDGGGAFRGAIVDREHPLRTPLGIAIGRRSGTLFIASLNTARVDVYGTEPDPGGGGGGVPVTFEASAGGGSCSVPPMPPAEDASAPGGALAIFLPVALLYAMKAREAANTRARPGKGPAG